MVSGLQFRSILCQSYLFNSFYLYPYIYVSLPHVSLTLTQTYTHVYGRVKRAASTVGSLVAGAWWRPFGRDRGALEFAADAV
jgi:hypothetical protein